MPDARSGRITVLTLGLSGMLAGLAGARGLRRQPLPCPRVQRRLRLRLDRHRGVLGRNHPLGVVLSAFLFGAMRSGATQMQFRSQVSVDIISVIQALILMFVAADAIIRWIYRIKAPATGEEVVLTRGWGG